MIIKDIIGIENLKNLSTGAVITCNHFNAFDSFAMHYTYEKCIDKRTRKHKKFFRVIREGNYTSFPGFYGKLMRNCYTLPLASNKSVLTDFLRSTRELLEEGNLVLIYPEQSMWWNYRKPKPLQKGAFNIAYSANVPVVPVFICMSDSNIIDSNGYNVQEYTIYIDKPIYPNSNLNKIENINYLMNTNYEVWKNIYESFYNKKLIYTTKA